MTRKEEFSNALLITAVQMQTLSATLRNLHAIEDAENNDVRDDTGLGTFNVLQHISAGCLHFHSLLSGPGSRGPYDQLEKCPEYFKVALSWPDRHFRHTFRMGRRTFEKLVHILEKDDIFQSTGKKPQRPVRYQLACFLRRYGMRGSDSLLAANLLGIGHGTVFLYCRRVSRALRKVGLKAISWGNDARHGETAGYISEHFGFPNCIGIVDGSLIRLTQAPRENGPAYYCRKKYPAINIQAIVDHERRFISYDMGWPGSVSDVTIWKRSHLWRHRRDFFREDKYILADKGYPSTPYTLRPFTEPEVQGVTAAEQTRRRQFNRRLSSIRIYVEHAFGMLKGRFESLRDLGTESDIQGMYQAVQAMMVIHNLCIDFGDAPEHIPLFNNLPDHNPEEDIRDIDVEVSDYGGEAGDGVVEIPGWETDEWLKEAGRAKRTNILNQLFPEV